ncbi:hypothetical protein S245_020736 [Arachis hypogaea]
MRFDGPPPIDPNWLHSLSQPHLITRWEKVFVSLKNQNQYIKVRITFPLLVRTLAEHSANRRSPATTVVMLSAAFPLALALLCARSPPLPYLRKIGREGPLSLCL